MLSDFHKEVYVQELWEQCRRAIQAYNSIYEHLRAFENPRNPHRWQVQGEVFRAIHSFLTHASNASLLLFPSKHQSKQKHETKEQYKARTEVKELRGNFLRDLVGADSADHVLSDRTLRNHLEQFDERIDSWVVASQTHGRVDDFIGPLEAYDDIDAADQFRHFDPETSCFYFHGETYDLVALARALNDIGNTASTCLRKRR